MASTLAVIILLFITVFMVLGTVVMMNCCIPSNIGSIGMIVAFLPSVIMFISLAIVILS